MSTESGWIVRPSFKYDLFGFLSAISYDKFYNRFYPDESKEWQEALGDLIPGGERLIGGISMSNLGHLFSFVQAETIDEILSHLEDMSTLEREVKARGGRDNLVRYLLSDAASRKELIDVIKALKEKGYPEYWQTEIKPIVEEECEELEAKLSAYSVESIITDVDAFLGPDYRSDAFEITIYLSYFSLPISYALPGNQSVHSFSKTEPIDAEGFVSTLIHELLHKLEPSDELKAYYKDLLSKDTFFAEKHDYLINVMKSGDNEDYVIGAEAYLTEKLGVASRENFYDSIQRSHSGSTVIAPVIYSQLIEQGGSSGDYNSFLTGLFRNKAIEAGKVQKQFYSALEKVCGRHVALSEQIFETIRRNLRRIARAQEQALPQSMVERHRRSLEDSGFQVTDEEGIESSKVGIKEFPLADSESALRLSFTNQDAYRASLDIVEFRDDKDARKFWSESSRGQWHSGSVNSGKGIWIFHTIKNAEGNTATATWIHGNWFMSVNVLVPVPIDPDFEKFQRNATQKEAVLKTVRILDQVIAVCVSAVSPSSQGG